MKTSVAASVAVAALVLAIAAPASAQTAPAGSTTNMDILVAKIKADKKLLVAQTVGLTDAEGKAFWPVYDACQAELETINKRLKSGIEGYAKDYNAGHDDRHEGGGAGDRSLRHRRGPAGVPEVLRREAERRDPGDEDRALRAGRE